jgi:twinkle protein
MQTIDLGDLDKWVEPPKIAGQVQPLADFADEIIDLIRNDPATQGDPLPWAKTQGLFRMRPHELTVWAGENGAWKSTVLSQVLLHLTMQGRSALIASLEMTARQVGKRLIMQACCCENPSDKAIRDFLESTRDRLLILNLQGRIRPKEAIALLRWASIERKVNHVALDNLTKIVSVSNEASGEMQSFISDAQGVALDTGTHVHLVAHVRKPAADDAPGRYDIRGSGTISDQADNVVMCWRNRQKEEAIDDGSASDEQRMEPDFILRVAKQRHAMFEGQIRLWAHRSSMQFVPDGHTPPIPYAFERGDRGAH